MAENKTDKLEREYIIPLRHRWSIVPRYQRANKAVRSVKEFLVRHMKIRDRDLDKIRIEKSLNELIWFRGIRNPPASIKVKAIKDGDIVRVEGVDLPNRIKFKKLREEKLENSAKEVAKKRKSEKVVGSEQVQASSVEDGRKKKTEDENKDGVEDKKAEEEKKEAVIEAGKEIEEKLAKQEKHTTKVMTPKQEKNQQTQYNKSGRGH